jgi:hypothetical protein
MAIGERQRLYFNGADWSALPSDSSMKWSALFGAQGSDIWVGGGESWSNSKAGGESSVLEKWNGSSLAEAVGPDLLYDPVAAGWAGSDIDVWVTFNRYGTRVMHWNGQQWAHSGVGCDDQIGGSIWGFDSDIWVLGTNGAILRLKR